MTSRIFAVEEPSHYSGHNTILIHAVKEDTSFIYTPFLNKGNEHHLTYIVTEYLS